jgi:hypothetical protein
MSGRWGTHLVDALHSQQVPLVKVIIPIDSLACNRDLPVQLFHH